MLSFFKKQKTLPTSPVKGLEEGRYEGPPPKDLLQRGELEKLFWGADGPIVHKWHHYLALYERYFGAFRGKKVKMLEIGVFKGGSLEMWRRWLGPDAILFGVDIDKTCAAFDGVHGKVRIGSQDDPEFLKAVVDEMGGVDIVLDDGSHESPHIRTSFETLYPILNEGGLYMVEDLHATYWSDFRGGYQHPQSFMSDVKQLIDDMHHWYHDHGEKVRAAQGMLTGIHIHDSMVVFEKARVARPFHSQHGQTV